MLGSDDVRWAGLVCAVWMVGCGPTPTVEKQHPVVTRTDPAGEGTCPNGGTVVKSGLDLDDDATLDGAEVTTANVVCSPPQPVGPSWLVAVAPEPRGSHCVEGGTAVRSGHDTDGDGVLGDAEVEHVEYACAGRLLTHVLPEPVGANCAQGGFAVQSGAEANGNGVLDADEVQTTEYACDAALLTRMESEPVGAHCVGGGITFLVGRDDDGDQTLEDTEVEWTEYECSDVVSQNVTISWAGDVATLAHVKVITGSVVIVDASLTELALPMLERIGGRLVVSGNANLESVSMPALGGVSGYLDVSDNARLTTLDLLKLQRVDGDLSVTGNARLTGLGGLSSLVMVGLDCLIADNAALLTAEVPLSLLGGSLTVTGNPSLETVTWFMRRGPTAITVAHNEALTELSVSLDPWTSEWTTIGPVSVHHNAALGKATVDGPVIRSIDVFANPTLGDLIVSVDRVEGNTRVWDDPSLKSASFLPSTTFDGPMDFVGAVFISAPVSGLWFGLGAKVTVGSVSIDGTNLTSLDYGIGFVRGTLRLSNNALLQYARVLDVQGGIELVNNDALMAFWISWLGRTVKGNVTVADNDALLDVSTFQHVDAFAGDVTITGNRSLLRPAIYGPTRIGGSLTVTDNPSLMSLDFPAVQSIGGSVRVARNGLTSWRPGPWPKFSEGLDTLATVGGSVEITANQAMQSAGMPALRTVVGALSITDNPSLFGLELPLVSANVITVTNNPVLSACVATALLSHSRAKGSQSGNDESQPCP